MYIPNHFNESRTEVLHALMRRKPFATLAVTTAMGVDASHIPLLIDPVAAPLGTLRGHMARINPTWQAMQSSGQALAIFGTQGVYISPAWYATKQEHGKVVPTWDYTVVHARGSARIIEDATWLRAHLDEIVTRFEAPMPQPWHVTDAPDDYIEKLMRGIVGFEIEITDLRGQWKLSQNRSDADRAGVVKGLRAQGDDEALYVAELVATRGAV